MHVTSAIAATWAAGLADKKLLPIAIGASVYGVTETFVKQSIGDKIILGAAVVATVGTFYHAYTTSNKTCISCTKQ
jgi:hypothetical protein